MAARSKSVELKHPPGVCWARSVSSLSFLHTDRTPFGRHCDVSVANLRLLEKPDDGAYETESAVFPVSVGGIVGRVIVAVQFYPSTDVM